MSTRKMPTRKQIMNYMKGHYWEFIDDCDDVNATKLAEYTALDFEDAYEVYEDEITFDIDELFFECAADIANLYEQGMLQ